MNWVNKRWSVNWSLLLDGKTESWTLSALDLDILMSSGVDVATDQISSQFAVFADSANDGELMLRVSDLNSVSQYATAAHYLSSLAPVKNVYAKEVNPSQVDFYIELSGDENDLRRIIALGKVLVPDTRPKIKPQTLPESHIENKPMVTQNASTESTDQQSTTAIKNEMLVPEKVEKPAQNILRYRLNG